MKKYMIVGICSLFLINFGTFQQSSIYAQSNEIKRMTATDLLEMLNNMGYKSEKVTDHAVRILWNGKDLDFSIRFMMVENGEYLFMESYLRPIENAESVTAESWRKILTANDNIGRCKFTFDEKGKKLYMDLKIPNANLTPKLVRQEMEYLAEKVESTKGIWYKENLKTEKNSVKSTQSGDRYTPSILKVEQEKPFSLEGNWIMSSAIINGVEKPYNQEDKSKVMVNISKNEIVAMQNGKVIMKQKYKIDNSIRPIKIDYVNDKGMLELGLVKVVNPNEFAICFPNISNQPRPAAFASTQQNKQVIMNLRRAK